jgi:NADPH-dependent 2,4-dienoyl-CoA reductase/sulfur reductase-like enzyme
MSGAVDVTIIGCGPAGMAAASRCAEAALSVALLDEQVAPGGQIYRAIERNAGSASHLGEDYAAGLDLVRRFRSASVQYLPEASVWHVEPGFVTSYLRHGKSALISSKALVVATGAQERPFPVPGWTLPGVMTVGALQILLKANNLVSSDAVLVGTGPLLLLLASQMVSAGKPPRAIVETMPRGQKRAALPLLPAALSSWRSLKKGYLMLETIRRANIPFYRHATDIVIEGKDACQGIFFISSGKSHYIDTPLVALHQGIIPNPQVARLLDCGHAWDKRQQCFLPVTDDNFESSVENVFIAGDAAGIGGAVAAACRGEIVGQALVKRLSAGKFRSDAKIRSDLKREISLRPFLETLYEPSPIEAIADETIVCRCEEVTAGDVRKAVALGASGPNQVKAFSRGGMGPCQGRMCGNTITRLVSDALQHTPDDVGYMRIRPPLKPLTVSEMAAVSDRLQSPIAETRKAFSND